jgi:hypothetical protein
MVRIVCTWVLIVLAASPFTAPFSTCDLSALLGRHSSAVLVLSVAECADMADGLGTGDAGSISPVVGRVLLTREVVLVRSDWPLPRTSDRPVLARLIPIEGVPTLEDSPLQPTVLRL